MIDEDEVLKNTLVKIQTTAQINAITIEGNSRNFTNSKTIELEFSAIDAGGGFKDPILDFSFTLEDAVAEFELDQAYQITLTLSNPDKENSEVTFTYEGILKQKNDHIIEVNGRLKEDRLPREVIGFVLQLLR